MGGPRDSLTPSESAPTALIDDRYRVEAQLGRGGAARVYRVLDERSGERFALKRLAARHRGSELLRVMFEREYYTLVQLAHPRIVRAFEFGLDGEQPYYTMELLAGRDARERLREGTPSVAEICTLLCDVASALALVHSRRMVHRDVSVRNVWCMPDGRAKLIDFGTLVAAGAQTKVVGTPPFIPPEAVYLQPLEARSDLFGLGALAYYLLVGRNAYPARDIAELRHAWQSRPPRPDALRPEVPRALSDLVMALLSLDLRGRPSSAAEVFDHLSAIAELPIENERRVAQAFLTTPKLVGRDEPAALLRERLKRARRTRGRAHAIVAPSGLGRSRMLASFVLEAKLFGATVIAVDAAAAGSSSLDLATAIAERLVELLPLTAAAAADLAPVLGHLSPELHRALAEPVLAELNPHDQAARLASAVFELIATASRQHNLVIAVDDIHRGDERSLGVLARLATRRGKHRLLLVTTCDEAALHAAPPVLESLLSSSRRIGLAPLGPEATRELLGSLFGEVPGLDEAARFLHELSLGSPQTCMQYAQYLVDRGIARYENGRWLLPPDLRQQPLPPNLDAMLQARVAELSPDARALALGMALARDDTRASWQPECHVRVEDFAKLLGCGEHGAERDSLVFADAARAYAALDELLRLGLVRQQDEHYVLGQRAMVDALVRQSDEASRRRTHERLARIFEQPAYGSQWLGVRQLQRAGAHEQARARILSFTEYFKSGAMNWRNMRVSVSAECARTALAHLQASSGPREAIALRRLLLFTSAVYDWSVASCGQEQIAQLRADCGLIYWDETDPSKPEIARVLECLGRAQREYEQKPEAERGYAPGEAVRELVSCAVPLQGAFGNSHDIAALRALPEVLEPLRPLSPIVALLVDLVELARDRALGRELGDRTLELGVRRLSEAAELPALLRQGAAGINSYHQALLDARCGRRRGMELMDTSVAETGEEAFLVVHARWLVHAFRGNANEAARLRARAEIVTEDDVWRRKASLYFEAELHALTGDLASLQRTVEAMAELARAFPGWRPLLAWARGHVHRLRGGLDQAKAELETALALAPAGEHRAWVRAAPAHAEVLLLSGELDAAVRAAEQIVAAVEEHGLDRTAAVYAERVRALALSARGEHDAAKAALERAFALAGELEYGGLPLATLHEAGARIALASERRDDAARALVALHGLIEHAEAPAFVRSYEALRAASKEIAAPELASAVTETSSRASDTEDELITAVRTRLDLLNHRKARAHQALALLMDDCNAERGHLFLFDEGGLFAAASIGAAQGGEALLELARRLVETEFDRADSNAATMVDDPRQATSEAHSRSMESQLTPVLLSDAGEEAALSGVVLLAASDAPPRPPRMQLLRAVSRYLSSAGDTLPRALGA